MVVNGPVIVEQRQQQAAAERVESALLRASEAKACRPKKSRRQAAAHACGNGALVVRSSLSPNSRASWTQADKEAMVRKWQRGGYLAFKLRL